MAEIYFTRDHRPGRDQVPSITRLRNLWICLCEIQFALEQDEITIQDRRNRFSTVLSLVLEEADACIEKLEKASGVLS